MQTLEPSEASKQLLMEQLRWFRKRTENWKRCQKLCLCSMQKWYSTKKESAELAAKFGSFALFPLTFCRSPLRSFNYRNTKLEALEGSTETSIATSALSHF
jgi:hypothetical protein